MRIYTPCSLCGMMWGEHQADKYHCQTRSGSPRFHPTDVYQPSAVVGEQVKCINVDGVSMLAMGQVYQVKATSKSHDTKLPQYLLVNYTMTFYQSRFQLVENITSTSTSVAALSLDIEEEKCWQAMRPRLAPDECICGIKKVMCTYHR